MSLNLVVYFYVPDKYGNYSKNNISNITIRSLKTQKIESIIKILNKRNSYPLNNVVLITEKGILDNSLKFKDYNFNPNESIMCAVKNSSYNIHQRNMRPRS